jgi:hypothetical protein
MSVRVIRRKLLSPSAGIKSGSARRFSERQKDMRVVHRNAAMTVRHHKYKRSGNEPMGMSSETSEHILQDVTERPLSEQHPP